MVSLEGKNDGYGVPEGLPLSFRFSCSGGFDMPRENHAGRSSAKIVNSISQWRTLILVNFDCDAKVLALFFPYLILRRTSL
jgi:hypothetical protein